MTELKSAASRVSKVDFAPATNSSIRTHFLETLFSSSIFELDASKKFMKYFYLLFISFLFGLKIDAQATKPFKKKLTNEIVVTGLIDTEVPDYVFNMKCEINGKVIYKADSLTEFEFVQKNYPIVSQIGPNKFQLLLEQNERPNKNLILDLVIENSKIVSKTVIPSFDSTFINSNNQRVYCGVYDYNQEDEHKRFSYIPTLFFINSKNGLSLDSNTTISYNKKVWGKFYGFTPNYKLNLKPNY
ncbi:hypothetical protein [Limnovirga soli]|uniref:Uncharacterized protein n=1 Tax=Limnovirga soli TaxID=2656915 RepID=A0A8J8FIM4_9BACT|nr:hypothetical protein [Limnovirga soli]NNV58032.1 hypothetical protein [Limnovirga soli]